MQERFESISLQLGASADERRFVWHCRSGCTRAVVRYAETGSDNWKLAEGVCAQLPREPEATACKVRVFGLEPGKKYTYYVGDEHGFCARGYTFVMPSAQSEKRVFQMVADIHQRMHGFTSTTDELPTKRRMQWEALLERMHSYCPASEFVLSGGDNICTNNMGISDENGELYFSNRCEYAAVFAPERMRTIPFASVIGNHDMPGGNDNTTAGMSAYHFDLPNDDGVSGHYGPHSMGDFWYRFGDTLLIGICIPEDWTGAKAACAPEVHRAYIQNAIAKNADAKWRILVNHIPPYAYVGTAARLSKIRTAFEAVVRDIDIDVVFSADSHAFSRSKHILAGEVAENAICCTTDENGYQTAYVKNPKGSVHINIPAAMDHSFVKTEPAFAPMLESWGVRKEDAEKSAPAYDGMVYSSPMFAQIEIEKDALCVRVLRSDTFEAIDTYTIYKA